MKAKEVSWPLTLPRATPAGPSLSLWERGDCYSLTDRATWLKFKNKGDLAIVLEGDPVLFNQYGIILVNPKKHPHVKTELSQTFIDWSSARKARA